MSSPVHGPSPPQGRRVRLADHPLLQWACVPLLLSSASPARAADLEHRPFSAFGHKPVYGRLIASLSSVRAGSFRPQPGAAGTAPSLSSSSVSHSAPNRGRRTVATGEAQHSPRIADPPRKPPAPAGAEERIAGFPRSTARSVFGMGPALPVWDRPLFCGTGFPAGLLVSSLSLPVLQCLWDRLSSRSIVLWDLRRPAGLGRLWAVGLVRTADPTPVLWDRLSSRSMGLQTLLFVPCIVVAPSPPPASGGGIGVGSAPSSTGSVPIVIGTPPVATRLDPAGVGFHSQRDEFSRS